MLTVVTAANAPAVSAPFAEPATAAHTTERIRLDGRLDESSWENASPVTRFFEIYPGNVQTPRVPTEGRFLYDDRNIYVAIRAFEPQPSTIRSSLVRRDQVSTDQDYLELIIDAQGQRDTAMVFRTNARGVLADALFNEDTQARNLSPDFNFDARAVVDEAGWTAEFLIPLSTLRYRLDGNQAWTFAIFRNRPRDINAMIASVPSQRSSNCTLCLAGYLRGMTLREQAAQLYLTPYLSHRVGSDGRETSTGVDSKWQLRPETIVDVTIAPDFSQVDVDALQLGANTLFAIATAEKRPFFLEGADLLSTPISANYTRVFADPDAGVRFTSRGDTYDYTALVLREGAGDRVLEPGTVSSSFGALDDDSTALVARYKWRGSTTTLGTLASGRTADGGGHNFVAGADMVWTPSKTDRIITQVLWSETRNPDRQDLLPAWSGQSLHGGAALATWDHTGDPWNGSLSYSIYSRGFRAWNGFVSQVDVARVSAAAGLNFYPDNPLIVRISPSISFSHVGELGGSELSRSISSGLSLEMSHGTTVSLSWSPDVTNTTIAGRRASSSVSLGVSTTPVPWMPGLSLTGALGSASDVRTGETGDSTSWSASMPLRVLGRLELNASIAHQSLKSRRPDVVAPSLFSETNRQLNTIWHYSGRIYFQGTLQQARLDRAIGDAAGSGDASTTNKVASALLSYQANWQTRYFVGFRRIESRSDGTVPLDRADTEVFAKFSHVFSM